LPASDIDADDDNANIVIDSDGGFGNDVLHFEENPPQDVTKSARKIKVDGNRGCFKRRMMGRFLNAWITISPL